MGLEHVAPAAISEHKHDGGHDTHVDLPGQHGNNLSYPVVHRSSLPHGTGQLDTGLPGVVPAAVQEHRHGVGHDTHVDLPGQHGNDLSYPVVHRSSLPHGTLSISRTNSNSNLNTRGPWSMQQMNGRQFPDMRHASVVSSSQLNRDQGTSRPNIPIAFQQLSPSSRPQDQHQLPKLRELQKDQPQQNTVNFSPTVHHPARTSMPIPLSPIQTRNELPVPFLPGLQGQFGRNISPTRFGNWMPNHGMFGNGFTQNIGYQRFTPPTIHASNMPLPLLPLSQMPFSNGAQMFGQFTSPPPRWPMGSRFLPSPNFQNSFSQNTGSGSTFPNRPMFPVDPGVRRRRIRRVFNRIRRLETMNSILTQTLANIFSSRA